MNKHKYDNFVKALGNLMTGAKKEPPYSLLEETGMVGLFEICFEQAWKLMKASLELQGRNLDKIASPRGIIKIAYQCGMIDDEEGWLNLLKRRNLLAHTYNDEDILPVIEEIRNSFLPLFVALQRETETNWLEE